MNLHLCLDGNFIQQAIDAFERFYPKDNLFIMFNTSKKENIEMMFSLPL